MTHLTTQKIVNTIQDFKGALKRGPLHVFDAVYEHDLTRQLYDGTLEHKTYHSSFWKHHDVATTESRGTLWPGADFGYKPDQTYYLVGPFEDRQKGRSLHLRFENPGNGDISSLHLTDEGAMTRLNADKIDESYDMRGHLFFELDAGKVVFCKVGGPHGSPNKQMSDARLFSYVPEVTAMLYYWMYHV